MDEGKNYGEEPYRVAHFLIQLLFCVFAEDTGLLPDRLFTGLVEQTRPRPQAIEVSEYANQLAQATIQIGFSAHLAQHSLDLRL